MLTPPVVRRLSFCKRLQPTGRHLAQFGTLFGADLLFNPPEHTRADLERQATAQQKEPAELRAARTELAELQRRYEDQMRKVEELERQATEAADLQAARARFAKVQQTYRQRHPKYQEALGQFRSWRDNRRTPNDHAEQDH